MRYKNIEGYKYPYRVSDEGDVERQWSNGEWKKLKPHRYRRIWRVELKLPEGGQKRVAISKLVVDAFMGGTPPGMIRVHKNGMGQDNAVENIIFLTRTQSAKRRRSGNSIPVMKIDRRGEVVEVYSSGSEAARKNHISQSAISARCRKLIKDARRLDGYDYRFADSERRHRNENNHSAC